MPKSNKIIGIDLGTTNSCVCVMEGTQVTVITNEEGRRVTPSVVAFLENGERKVGDPAKRQAILNPKRTVYSIKRLMGKRYDEVLDEIKRLPYTVEKMPNGLPGVRIDDKVYTPQEISAFILQKMKKIAENYLGTEVTDAVITVPAYFNDSQRRATKEAGEIAGLNVRRVFAEPTASALAFGLDKAKKNLKVAVYDLGGGTFDISFLELGDGVFEVKATSGDTHLGGDDFDNAIIRWLIDEFKKETGIDLSNDPVALQRLKDAAERAKIELSSSMETDISLTYITADPHTKEPKHLVKKLTRATFEKLIYDLVMKTIPPCEEALRKSNWRKEDIDEVILVGGSTRVPLVQKVVEDFFGKKPNKSVNPDEAVGIGAAIQGAIISGEVKDILLLDVIPLSLGVETLGGIFVKMIEGNTTIPTKKSQIFTTATDNQTTVEIAVYQGERPMAKDNKFLGHFYLEGIPPAPRGVPQIEVTFDVDANGILTVTAQDKATGKQQSIRIEGSTGLSKEQIDKMKEEAARFAQEDKKKKEAAEKIVQADSLIYQTENFLKEHGNKIPADKKSQIESVLAKLKDAHSKQYLDEIDRYIKELNEVLKEAGRIIYQQAGQSTSGPQQSSDNQGNVKDIPYEEINK